MKIKMEERQSHKRKEAENGRIGHLDSKMPTHCSWTPVQKHAFEIAEDVVKFMVGTQSISTIRPPNPYAKTMRRTVRDVSQKHEKVFNGMARKLGFNHKDVTTVLGSVLDEVFSDGQYNWGRLVMVYAFAGWMARHCANNDMHDYIQRIAHAAGLFVANKLALWIENNGGWDGFEQFFSQPETAENLLWCGLVCTIVSLGVGALATALIVK